MAVTQDELYAALDLELSWSERALPEHVRTKHVHRLHPYHGKFIPQLVEVLLDRYFTRGAHVLDPFAGSGTTLVQGLESGLDATGVELAAFNCLLIGVKTAEYDVSELGDELRDVVTRLPSLGSRRRAASAYVRSWYAPQAIAELVAFCELIDEYAHADVLRVVLSRAARSSRRAAHFDLEAPRAPQVEEYWCHKHKRICKPIESAVGFLRRYTLDTLRRIEEFDALRGDGVATVLHADSRDAVYDATFDGVLTSPPYPGLIDYHEQHRYAYELLGLDDRRELELGAAADGTSKSSLEAYCAGIADALANAAASLADGAPVLVVVNDRRDLYPSILDRAGLTLESRLRRHVNRRTGRRAGEYYEDVLVARVS